MGNYLHALAVLIVISLVTTTSAHAEDPCAEGRLVFSEVTDRSLVLDWTGLVRYEMGRQIADAFDQAKDRVKAVVLTLSSCGGDGSSMKRTIQALRDIKRTHDLVTVVRHGDLCASACVSIFLEGSRRIAALTSSWLFHEPSWQNIVPGHEAITRITVPSQTEAMLKDYAAAGVSKRWLNWLRAEIKSAEYWQTGRDLWEGKSGIITEVLSNSVPRFTEEQLSLSGGLGEKPRPVYLPDPMDMLGMPIAR